MKQTPPRTQARTPPRNSAHRLALPAPACAPATNPAALAAGLSLTVLAAAQASLPAVQRCRAAIGSRGSRWTRTRQVAFLAALAETHCVASAARSVGMSRQSAYALRARLRDEPFGMAWDAAYVSAPHSLYRAALRRAIEGVEVPHYVAGALVGTSRHYDERLTLALLAMPAPVPEPLDLDTPGSRYEPDDFRALLRRVERGPERFEADDTARARGEDEEAQWRDAWDADGEEEAEDDDGDSDEDDDPYPPELSPWDE